MLATHFLKLVLYYYFTSRKKRRTIINCPISDENYNFSDKFLLLNSYFCYSGVLWMYFNHKLRALSTNVDKEYAKVFQGLALISSSFFFHVNKRKKSLKYFHENSPQKLFLCKQTEKKGKICIFFSFSFIEL